MADSCTAISHQARSRPADPLYPDISPTLPILLHESVIPLLSTLVANTKASSVLDMNFHELKPGHMPKHGSADLSRGALMRIKVSIILGAIR